MEYLSHSEEETLRIGAVLSQNLKVNSIVCFFGDLGAGKTTLIKGIAAEAAGCSPDEVNSPTFVYLNIYEGERSVYHFDLYRLKDSEEFVAMGFDEMFDAGGICCMEWSERIADYLPSSVVNVFIEHAGEGVRKIKIEGVGNP